ncbi:MAG: hypothetical protein KC589_02820 [Nanoarchaeota archaeon]|nr:hypothetical protein [Nanoarchaeota archaeon]
MEKIKQQLEENINHSLTESIPTNKFLIKSFVGLGKTNNLHHIEKFTNESVVISFPTHNLKEEFIRENKGRIKNIQSTPTPPKELVKLISLQDDEIELEYLHKKIKEKFPAYYKSLNLSITKPDSTIVTTHDAFFCSYFKFNQNIIIFDEVPNRLFGDIQNTSNLGINELSYLISISSLEFNTKKLLIKYIDDLLDEIKNNNPFLLQKENSPILIKLKNPIPENLREVLLSLKFEFKVKSYFFKKITSILQHKLLYINYCNNSISSYNKFKFNDNKKYICLSATPNEFLFNKYNFKILKTDIPELKANIINIPINTSKLSLSNQEIKNSINKIISKEKIECVISYKNTTFQNQTYSVYFGCGMGTNKFDNKYKNVGIVGTPMNGKEYFYSLAIQSDKLELSYSDYEMKLTDININNKIIPYLTFKHDWLAEEQLNQIENEIIQIIGRFRPIQNNVNIFLFSKLPILCKI